MATTARLVTVVENKGASKAEKELRGYGKAAGTAEKKSNTLLVSAKKLGKGLAVFGTVAVATGGAITSMAVASARSQRELENLARQAGLTTIEFRALAFATEQYGINGEQIADISKDIADKVGEFATAGTGAFQDYIDVMGLTKEEGVALAREFQTLSGREVLQRVTREMEAAGATTGQMTFALESLGNDASRLIPLLADNGKELGRLEGKFKGVAGAMALNSAESEGLTQLAATSSLVAEQAGLAATKITASLAPALDAMFSGIISKTPAATNAIVDFFNSFKDAENQIDPDSIDRQIEDQLALVARLNKNRAIAAFSGNGTAAEEQQLKMFTERVDRERVLLVSLQDRKKELEEIERLESVETPIVSNVVQGNFGNFGGSAGLADSEGSEDDPQKNLANTAVEESQRAQEAWQESIDSIGDSFGSTFASALTQTRDVGDAAKVAARAIGVDMVQALIKNAARQAINKGLAIAGITATTTAQVASGTAITAAMVPAATAASVASFGAAPATGIGTMIASIAAGVAAFAGISGREQGGSVNAGTPYKIAEREPEIFMPKTAGNVVKMSDMQGGKQDVKITFIDQSTAGQPSEVVQQRSGDQIIVTKRSIMADLRNPNSDFSKALNQRRA